jgi:hypothetical protein
MLALLIVETEPGTDTGLDFGNCRTGVEGRLPMAVLSVRDRYLRSLKASDGSRRSHGHCRLLRCDPASFDVGSDRSGSTSWFE